MADFITYISTLNMSTWLIIGFLVGAGGYIMQQIVDSKLLTTMFMLAFQGGAIGLNFLSQKYTVDALPNPEMNLIALSTLGMIVALFIALIAMRVCSAFQNLVRPKVQRP